MQFSRMLAGVIVVGVALFVGPTQVAAVDTDGDGYDDALEAYFVTDSTSDCPATSTANDEVLDAWPPDFNDDQMVNTLDVFQLLPPTFGSTVSSIPEQRFDLNADGLISIPDLVQLMPPMLGSTCPNPYVPGPVTGTTNVIAIDMNTDGNAARTVGAIDVCGEIDSRGTNTIEIDVVLPAPGVNSADGIEAFEFSLNYDQTMVEVTVEDQNYLLAKAPLSVIDGLSDSLPDTSGSWRSGALDISAGNTDPETAGGTSETGSGVLTRITLTGVARGKTALTLTGVYLIAGSNAEMPVTTVLSAWVYVDEVCPSEVKKLLASNAGADDGFGWSVAVDADTAVVGAPYEDDGGTDAGAAYVSVRDQGGADNWGEVKKLVASTPEALAEFGYSVAVDGDTIVVGARLEDAGGPQAGAAYVFERSQGGPGNWGEVKKLTASGTTFSFGHSVALSGDTVIVGAKLESAGGAGGQGAAYVFGRNEGGADNWGLVKRLTASNAGDSDLFGTSAAISDDTAVVGAIGEDTGGSDAGAAYVFVRDAGGANNWGEVTMLVASNAGANDVFALTVALSGDTVVVGAFKEDTGDTDAGAAYVFERDEGGLENWGEVKKLVASSPQFAHHFGYSVAVSGYTAVVGARRDTDFGINAGAAYVFERDEGGADNWGEAVKLIASDAEAGDQFGFSVAVRGYTAVVGAWRENAGGSFAGAAYVFGSLCASAPWPAPAGDADCDGWTSADEVLIGTIPNDPCPDTTAAIDDAWPADLDTAFGFRIINALDISLILPPVFGSTRAGGPPYLERLDVDRAFGDGVINALDVARILPPVFGSFCT